MTSSDGWTVSLWRIVFFFVGSAPVELNSYLSFMYLSLFLFFFFYSKVRIISL